MVEQGMDHPILSGYPVVERKAIFVHKYYLGLEMHDDPGVERAVASWETCFAIGWRRQQHLEACQEQIAEIEIHRNELAQQTGTAIPWEMAARDWIARYAADWRSGQHA